MPFSACYLSSFSPSFSFRFFYNRMGYWSDWSIPNLVTIAAAFTYITMLLVSLRRGFGVGEIPFCSLAAGFRRPASLPRLFSPVRMEEQFHCVPFRRLSKGKGLVSSSPCPTCCGRHAFESHTPSDFHRAACSLLWLPCIQRGVGEGCVD